MKTFYAFVFAGAALGTQAQVTIQSLNSLTFSPETATIELGETVTFNISGIHTATQVSEAVWMADGNSALPGGFHFTAGSHEYTPTEVGTIYYVCQPHAGMGMKGIIIVENSTGIMDNGSVDLFRAYPNPATDELNIEASGKNELRIVDVQGREVLRRMVSASDRVNITQLPEGNYSALLIDEKGATIGTQRITIAR